MEMPWPMANDDNRTASAASLSHDEDKESHLEDEDDWESHDAFIPVPKAESPDEDLVPCSALLCQSIDNQTSSHPLRVLFDGDGTGTMIHERGLCPDNTGQSCHHEGD